MPKVTGEVKQVATHDEDSENPRYGVRIGDRWYNGFGRPKCSEGDAVTIEYKKVSRKGRTYRNIEKLKVESKAKEAEEEEECEESEEEEFDESVDEDTPPKLDRKVVEEVRIASAVALKASVQAHGELRGEDNIELYTESVLKLAHTFRKWLLS